MDVKRKVRIDKDYCSSTVWCDGANWEESDFNFNERQLKFAEIYDYLWESAHKDYENVNVKLLELAEFAKFNLLDDLVSDRDDITWVYWSDEDSAEVIYKNEVSDAS